MVQHLGFIEEVLTTKQAAVLDLTRDVFPLNVRMTLENVVRDDTHILTNEDIGTCTALHLPEVIRHGEQVDGHQLIIVVNHFLQVQIRMLQ